MTSESRAQLQIHTCVLLWGFTAIFGRLISLDALPLVWWRMLIVAVILCLLPSVWRAWRAMSWRLIAAFAGIGLLVALHWLTFYGAIKLANASVGATCMALGPVFLAVVEPLITRRRFEVRELMIGVAVIPGVILVVGGVPTGMRLGIAIGALSALIAGIFSSFNKKLIHRANPLAMAGIELGAGALVFTPLALFVPHTGPLIPIPGPHDAMLLLLLGVGCTLLPFSLSLVALRHLTAFGAQLATNLEPVYAIILAIILLGEQRQLGRQFYGGVAIILGVVLIYPLVVKRASAPIAVV